jgi:hypothetical protein
MQGKILLKCTRTKSDTWKKEDIEKKFNLTKDGTINDIGVDFKILKKNYDKYDQFVLEPIFRYNENGDNKLKEIDDLIYFKIYAKDVNKETSGDELFVHFVYCGYVTCKKLVIRMS